MKSIGRPPNKTSREDIATEFGVVSKTVINWEKYGFLPKGQKLKGYGCTVWYEDEDFENLKKKMKKA